MNEALVHVGGRDAPLLVRINGDAPTFRLETEHIEATALAPLAPELLDFLEIAATVFFADSSVPRGRPTRPDMGTRWRRQLEFEIPVRQRALWSRPGISMALTDAVEFLTEDDVSFRFPQAPPDPPARQPYFDFGGDGAGFRADEVILFSGGLDSFAGALESLASRSSRVILLSHRSAQKVIPRQVELGNYLAGRFPGQVLHLNVTARRVGDESQDFDQRSRSLLFAALGQAVAQQFGAARLSFYENGVISHNLPISRQIVGTMATRTTHPMALTLLDRLARLVGPKPVPIENNFRWLTKTEVVRRIAENNALDQIETAVSCTSIRDQTALHTHCGACSQCLDRRFAMMAAKLSRHDPPDRYQTDVLLGARETSLSRTMSTEWLRHSMRFADLDEAKMLDLYGQELAWILRGHEGQPGTEVLRKTLDMHRRHGQAARDVLSQAIQDHALDLAERRLPETSLLRLHIGDDGQDTMGVGEDPRLVRRDVEMPRHHVDDEVASDLPPDPAAPLIVSFRMDGGRHVVAVEGLGSVVGKPAKIPHGLRPVLEEDRLSGLFPKAFRFTGPTEIPGLGTMSKDAIRQNIARCRRLLAEDFLLIHGHPPHRDLLIEGKQAEGYRLDPTIVIRPDSA